MHASRRRFIRSSLALAGTGLLTPAMLGSCMFLDEGRVMEIDYIGNQDGFEEYQEHFRRIKKCRIHFRSLEESLPGESNMVFINTTTSTKPAYLIMLLEQGKDILSVYPMGYNLSDYVNISEFMERYGRIVGLINPLVFYPSTGLMKEIIDAEKISLSRIQVNCHPLNLGYDFQVSGTAGTAQCLQRIVSQISDSYPVSIRAKANKDGGLDLIHIKYAEFLVTLRFDREQIGWTMKYEGDHFIALADHTGMLAVNNEVEPRLAPDPGIMEKSIRTNIENFIQAVRQRSEPRISHLDGLASIMLNNAVEESLKTGQYVDL